MTALVGIYSLSAALEKFIFKWNIGNVERVILVVSALLLIDPGLLTDIIGFVVLGGFLIIKLAADKKKVQAAA